MPHKVENLTKTGIRRHTSKKENKKEDVYTSSYSFRLLITESVLKIHTAPVTIFKIGIREKIISRASAEKVEMVV